MKPLPYLGVLPGRLITDGELRGRIVKSIYAGIGDPKARPNKCFDPHHAVRAVRGNQSVDLIICFECDWVYVFNNGKRTMLAISSAPQPTLDRLLK